MNPTEAELQKAYEREYFFGGEYANYFDDRPALEKNFKQRLTHLSRFLNPTSRLIEVGCSYGFFLNLAKPHVDKAIGYDITSDGIAYAKKEFGLEAYEDSFLNYTGPQADMVCMWDVIEHLPNPGEFIQKISTAIKPGGHIALTTGDIGAFIARKRGDSWRMVHPPTHLFYFDKTSMTALLARYGFKVISFRHEVVYRNMDSVLKQLTTRSREKPFVHACIKTIHAFARATGLTKWNFGLNTFDIMNVLAVKEEPTV
jgi:SAM-dependent methyltransferase